LIKTTTKHSKLPCNPICSPFKHIPCENIC